MATAAELKKAKARRLAAKKKRGKDQTRGTSEAQKDKQMGFDMGDDKPKKKTTKKKVTPKKTSKGSAGQGELFDTGVKKARGIKDKPESKSVKTQGGLPKSESKTPTKTKGTPKKTSGTPAKRRLNTINQKKVGKPSGTLVKRSTTPVKPKATAKAERVVGSGSTSKPSPATGSGVAKRKGQGKISQSKGIKPEGRLVGSGSTKIGINDALKIQNKGNKPTGGRGKVGILGAFAGIHALAQSFAPDVKPLKTKVDRDFSKPRKRIGGFEMTKEQVLAETGGPRKSSTKTKVAKVTPESSGTATNKAVVSKSKAGSGKMSPFGKAFSTAHDSGAAEFKFDGKRFHTGRKDGTLTDARRKSLASNPKTRLSDKKRAANLKIAKRPMSEINKLGKRKKK
jgi:hypothetical protein